MVQETAVRNAQTLDGVCKSVVDKCGANGAVPWVMMASLLYYHCDISILSDGYFDQLCKMIDKEWSTVTHPHRDLIGRAGFKAGSAYQLKLENYPMSVRGGAVALITGKGFGLTKELRDRIYEHEFVPPEEVWDTYRYGPMQLTWRQHVETFGKKALFDKLEKIVTEEPPAPAIRVRTRVPAPEPVIEPTPEPTVRIRTRVRPTSVGDQS